MKAIIKLIFIITLLVIGSKSYCQQCVLNMSDIFNNPGCPHWCWVHTSQNIINFYGEASPDELDIVEWVRNSSQNPGDTSCFDFPLSCCESGNPEPVLRNLEYPNYNKIIPYFINSPLTGDQLFNEFNYNKPVIIYVEGHYFIAYGISSSRYWVHIMDGGYGQQIRQINDIHPGGKPWLNTSVMKHSPNWSLQNKVWGTFEYSRCFSAIDTIRVYAEFKKVTSHPNQYYSLHTSGTVLLYEGFSLGLGCSLDIFNTNSNCP